MNPDFPETRFHWQSQSTTSVHSETGKRYLTHAGRGSTILLFVREQKSRDTMAEPYVFVGPARYLEHHGSRPMNITWALDHPLPARLFRTLGQHAVA